MRSLFRWMGFGAGIAVLEDQLEMARQENADLRKVIERQRAIVDDKLGRS